MHSPAAECLRSMGLDLSDGPARVAADRESLRAGIHQDA